MTIGNLVKGTKLLCETTLVIIIKFRLDILFRHIVMQFCPLVMIGAENQSLIMMFHLCASFYSLAIVFYLPDVKYKRIVSNAI